MKPSSKKALAWVLGVFGFILVVGIMNANKGESEWKPGEPWEKAVRQMQERAAKRARENPPATVAVPLPVAAPERSFREKMEAMERGWQMDRIENQLQRIEDEHMRLKW